MTAAPTPKRVDHTQILGLGVYRPHRVVPNSEIVEAISSSDEWIKTRSGIASRRWADADETIVFMATEASKNALVAAKIEASQIDAVIVATSTQNVMGPAAGPQVATALGINGKPGFDISSGCSGFSHALTLASDMVKAGTATHVLVAAVERLSDFIDPNDRTCAFIFADGAGSAVVGPSDEEGIGPVSWGSDGESWRAIRQDKDFQTFFREVAAAEEDGGHAERPYIRMEGLTVFRWAATSLEKACRAALDNAGVTVDDIDVFVPHQANLRITDALVRVLKLPETCVVAKDIVDAGNVSAASIPMAIERVIRDGEAKPGQRALVVGFGAGLAYAGHVLKLPPID